MVRSILNSRVTRLAVSLALVAAVIWQVGPRAVVPERLVWTWLSIATLLFLASNILGAWQWGTLLRSAGIALPPRVVMQAYFIGLFFNNFLIGNIGGDVIRAFDVRRETGADGTRRTAEGVASIVMDRVLGFFTMMCFGAAAIWIVHEDKTTVTAIVAALAAFLVIGVAITSRRIGARADRIVGSILPARLADTTAAVRKGFTAIRHRPGALIGAAGISFAVQGLRIAVHYCCARAIGLDIPFIHFFTFIPLVSVAAAFPISVGGLGTREWAAVALFGSIGVAGAGVVAMELFAHGVTLVSSFPGALAFVVRRTAHLAPAIEVEEV